MNNIAAHAERIARHYWGEPNAKLSVKGRTLRWGTKGSRELDLQKGAWYDFEEEEGGGVIDLVKRHGKLGISGSVADVLEREFGIQKQAQKALEPKQYIQRIHSYYDADGAEAYQALRMYPKSFRLRQPDGKGGYLHNIKGITPLPYNLPAIISRPTEPVFVVEGEQCADVLSEAGLLSTTNHGGAGKWGEEHAQHLEGRNVIVMADNDQVGHRHADAVVASLWGKANQIKRVDLPGLPDKGDVVDYLRTHTLEELVGEVRRVEPLTEAPQVAEGEIADEDGNALEPFETLDQDAVWSMPPVEFLVDQLLPERSFTMMYGAPGSGKSFLAIDMALSVANGLPWHGYETKQGAVLYIAGEGVAGMGKRWKAWTKHKGLTEKADMHVLPVAVNFMDEAEITRLLYTIDKLDRQFAMVVVDTVHRSMHGAEENSAAEMAKFIDACDTIQRHTGGTMLAVHHSGKSQAQGARGSNSLLGAVSTSLMVGKSEDIVTLRVEKQKDAEPIEGDLRFNMLVVPASISETSVVLELTDEPAPRRQKAAGWKDNPQAYHAFQALQNLLIDKGVTRIHVSEWHEAHTQKEPDLSKQQRQRARQVLLDAGPVVCDKKIVWINKELT